MREGRRKTKQMRCFLMFWIFLAVGGSFMSFFKSSSYLSDEFIAGIYENFEPLFNSSLLDEVKSVVQYRSLNGDESENMKEEESVVAKNDTPSLSLPPIDKSSAEKTSPVKENDARSPPHAPKELAVQNKTVAQSPPPKEIPKSKETTKQAEKEVQSTSPPENATKIGAAKKEAKSLETSVINESKEENQPIPEKVAARETATSSQNNGDKPLNVILLYPDDWRHDDIGGVAPVVRTPFLNRLATDGIRFTYNAATTSICWISRATLFTGQYVSRHGSTHLRYPRFTYEGHWNRTWPYMLQQNGYWVGHVGKWQFRDAGNFMKTAFNYSHHFEGRHWVGSKANHDNTLLMQQETAH